MVKPKSYFMIFLSDQTTCWLIYHYFYICTVIIQCVFNILYVYCILGLFDKNENNRDNASSALTVEVVKLFRYGGEGRN